MSGWRAPLAVSLGAIAGALLRYYFTLVINQWFTTLFPLGTFAINLTGAFGLGFFTTWTLKRSQLSMDLRLAITVGFFGAYTTFSTYELESMLLLEGGNALLGLLYWLGTAILGILCLKLGSFLASRSEGGRC